LEATVTTPENPSPQDPHPSQPGADGPGISNGAGGGEAGDEPLDPHDALRGLENQPRIDEQGYPTAYTAVPPPLNQQQGQGQGPGQEQGGQPEYGAPPRYNGQPQYGQAAEPAGARAGYGAGAQGGQNPAMHQQQPGYGYPPPPPGYNEPYGSPYGGGPVPGMPPYANWGQRVAAWLIDNLVAAAGISLLDASYYDWNRATRAACWVIAVVGVLWAIYNAYLAGRTGQSTGKRILGIRLARYMDGQVVGPGYGVLRLFMNAVFWAICIIPGVLNYLWPLWDRKSQTWSDKIASSVVVRAR
jgi:uncharacterized RDD family membrane protein YckC